MITAAPILEAKAVSYDYGRLRACDRVSLNICPGEVLGIIGESGSGKTTLLNCLGGHLAPTNGEVWYRDRDGTCVELHQISEARQRYLARTELGFVQQNPSNGLRMNISAGANIGERLLGIGQRHYGHIRERVETWLQKVEIDVARTDDAPSQFSGGMQQRLQIARNLISAPRLVFMDEPTGGLDVSVQARLLDLLRQLVYELHLSVIIVTHDLGVARLLTHRLMVMHRGLMVEGGLTDQVLDDPQHPYTQLLVSSILPT